MSFKSHIWKNEQHKKNIFLRKKQRQYPFCFFNVQKNKNMYYTTTPSMIELHYNYFLLCLWIIFFFGFCVDIFGGWKYCRQKISKTTLSMKKSYSIVDRVKLSQVTAY